jgi:dihydrofolate reductase
MKHEEEIRLCLMVARTQNGVIGHQGKMPWHIPSELAYFKRTTLGKPVLMGRKTWDSLYLKPLPGRDNLVLSRNANFAAPGCESFTDFAAMCERAKKLAVKSGASEAIIIGGAKLYALALPLADKIYLTDIAADVPGDVYFETPDPRHWKLVSVETGKAGPADDYPYFIKVFARTSTC